MKLTVKLLILLFLCSCAQKPTPMVYEQWMLVPSNPDKNLAIDEQFLKKSKKNGQASARSNSQREVLAP